MVGKYVSFIASCDPEKADYYGWQHWNKEDKSILKDNSYWPNKPHYIPKTYSYQIPEGASYMSLGLGTPGKFKVYEIWISSNDETQE